MEALNGWRILQQFKAVACANHWAEKTISLVLALKGPAAVLLQKVQPNSQNTYAESIYVPELRYRD